MTVTPPPKADPAADARAEDDPTADGWTDDDPTADDWTEDDDWTDETLALLRTLRAPHRRNRAKAIGFAVYCVVLLLIVWGAVPSLGLFLQASMGADYTGHGGDLLAAMPAGITAIGLATFLLLVRDGLWRGPVVPPRAAADWLLIHPVRPRPVLRPWFWLSCAVAAFPGLVAAVGGMVALGLTVRTGLPAALGWCLLGGLCVPLLATCAALVVERGDRAARWVRRLTPYLTLLIVALAGQSVLAVTGHPVRWLELVEMWSGPWGWAAIAALAPTPAAVAGGWVAAALLLVSTGAALVFADRAASTVPLARLRERARTAAGVLAALRTVELRSARLAVNSANGSARQRRIRLPAPRRAWLVVPWRDTLALLRSPARPGRAVVLAVPALFCAVLAHGATGGLSWLATAVALTFGYLAVAQFLEPARIETDDVRRASWSPYPFAALMLRHAAVPTLAGILLGLACAGALLAAGAGPAAWLAPAAAPPLVAAGLVNACRGVLRKDLLFSPAPASAPGTGGGTGPLLFAVWYAAGPAVGVAALTPMFSSALRGGALVPVGKACLMAVVVAALLLRWARARAAKMSRARPGESTP